MRKLATLSILLVLAACLPACSTAPPPQEFKSEAGRFTVMTPAVLQETVRKVETPSGEIAVHVFSAQQDDFAYFVSYCDYSTEIARPDNAERMLDGARDGALENVKGKLQAETRITLADHPGREMIIEARGEDRPPTIIKERLLMVKNRLYQIMVEAPRGKAGDKVIDDFLQSFKLLGQ